MTDFEALLRALASQQVRFAIVGGLAARIHGSTRLTQDLDIVYARDRDNLERLARALAPHQPYLRGAPPGLPFQLDVETLERGLNFTLVTDIGEIDLFGELAGVGNWQALADHLQETELFGVTVRCLDIETLIRAKRAAGRPKDLDTVAELELLREERD